MSVQTTASPHTTAGAEFSSLDRLAFLALREFGHNSAGQVSGEVMSECIFCANQALEDIMGHPYWDDGEVAYYISQDERRPIPDPIMVFGIAAYLAQQQSSQKLQMLWQKYTNIMNKILLRKKYGVNPDFHMSVLDKG